MWNNELFLSTKSVGHRVTFEILDHQTKQAFFPLSAVLGNIFYFRSHVLNSVAGLRAHPREEKSFI